MTLLRTMFATWYLGMIVALVLLVPTVQALTFGLRALFWVLCAFQAVTTGAVLPDF